MAAKERVLGLLAEKRRALITRAVTRGLDPRAPLRDSGIPWLGEIPAHWEIGACDGCSASAIERSETGEEELLTVSHLTGVTAAFREGRRTCSRRRRPRDTRSACRAIS